MMMPADVVIDAAATSPAAIVQPYKRANSGGSTPPTVEELAHLLLGIDSASGSATGPNKQARAMFMVVTSRDGQKQVVIPMVQVREDAANGPVVAQVDHAAPIPESLDQIKERLSLSVTQIAELFGVTRKAVYDWYEGAEPRPTMASRIATLSAVVAEEFPGMALQRLKAVWSVPVSNKSFRAVLNDDSIDPADLKTALSEKLRELAPRIMPAPLRSAKDAFILGEAHISELDRRADVR